MNRLHTDYASWLLEFRRLAAERDMAWVVSDRPDAHRDAFAGGATPDEELQALADMAQWRGCGCGGG